MDDAQWPLLEKLRDAKALPKRTFTSSFCDWLEWALNLLVHVPERNRFLSGNYGPVEESGPFHNLPVTGSIPACLNGAFLRNGPNPKHPPVARYHWFDGDGMIHVVVLKDGKASYLNRFVQTSRLRQEDEYGGAKLLKLGDMVGYVGLAKMLLQSLRSCLGVLDLSKGTGTGGTSVVYHNGSLMALQESDAPYVMQLTGEGEGEGCRTRDEVVEKEDKENLVDMKDWKEVRDLKTVGRFTYGGALTHPFTAHPKIDPVSGEMFLFGYQVDKKPLLVYRVVSPRGEMSRGVEVSLPHPVLMHDFAVTENYAIFMDLPLIFDATQIVKGRMPFVWSPERAARFGILLRHAESEESMRWFEMPPFFVFHTATAWEEGDEVVIFGCHLDSVDLDVMIERDQYDSRLFEFRCNLTTGLSSKRQLLDCGCEFPRINERLLGSPCWLLWPPRPWCRKHQFLYCLLFSQVEESYGLGKIDLMGPPTELDQKLGKGGCVAAFFPVEKGQAISEAVFVPKGDLDAPAEDDGYLLAFLYDKSKDASCLVIIDAKTMTKQATVDLPRRVPDGYHGIFVSHDELKKQHIPKGVETGNSL